MSAAMAEVARAMAEPISEAISSCFIGNSFAIGICAVNSSGLDQQDLSQFRRVK
jgi:hypothetical protein